MKAFRAQGIAVGFYFSPEDFHWLHTQRQAGHPPPAPRRACRQENPGLMKLDRAQLQELATRYGADRRLVPRRPRRPACAT